jgi:hypothetical protein
VLAELSLAVVVIELIPERGVIGLPATVSSSLK